MVWDGGAEATSISDTCLSRMMRDQADAVKSGLALSVTEQGRMVPAQTFSGFTGNSKVEVDIISDVHLQTPDGICLPALTTRMVPGQVDDISVSALKRIVGAGREEIRNLDWSASVS